MPGPQSREHYHPFPNSHKFDGLLPVLWHDEDDTIFRVPQRTLSLARVIPREAEVVRQPIHGLDTDPRAPMLRRSITPLCRWRTCVGSHQRTPPSGPQCSLVS